MEFAGQEFWVDSSAKHGNRKDAEAVLGDGKWKGHVDQQCLTILEAERVPKTDKLLKLKIDTGIDVRTVVSGIAGYYAPEKIIGQQVSVLVNLAPRKIKGIESQGMILMAEKANGELVFAAPVI